MISCGELLTTALARYNYEVFTFRTYPAELQGGPAMFQVLLPSTNVAGA